METRRRDEKDGSHCALVHQRGTYCKQKIIWTRLKVKSGNKENEKKWSVLEVQNGVNRFQ